MKGRLRDYRFHLDADGVLSYQGAPVENPVVLQQSVEGLEGVRDGFPYFTCAGETCLLEVEDTALVIRAIRTVRLAGGETRLRASLGHGIWDDLDPTTLELGRIPYARVRGWRARLTRGAWSQLAELIEERDGEIVLMIGERRHVLGLA